MCSVRITWFSLVLVAVLLAAATGAGQTEAGDAVGRLIERPYTAVFEVFMEGSEFAAEEPFAGETSDFDGRCSELTSAVTIASSGEGTGRYAGATLFGSTHCRWVSPEALMAGVEPERCVMHGMIRYDPFAGIGP